MFQKPFNSIVLFVVLVISNSPFVNSTMEINDDGESYLRGLAKVDCSLLKCAVLACEPGQTLFQPPGQCCPGKCRNNGTPKNDCSSAICFEPACASPFLPNGECCKTCPEPDCSTVKCASVLDCGENAIKRPGECCASCECSTISCSQITPCNEGERAVVPLGGCCPVCQNY